MRAQPGRRRPGRLVTTALGCGAVLVCLASAVYGWSRLPLRWQGWGLLVAVVCLAVGATGMAWDLSAADHRRREQQPRDVEPAGPLRRAAVLAGMAVLAVAEQGAGWLPVGALAAGGGSVLFLHLARRAGADVPVSEDEDEDEDDARDGDEDDVRRVPGHGVRAAGGPGSRRWRA